MRLLLSVEHPAWVHQFRYLIKELTNKGHEIKVVAIRKDVTCELLDYFDIPYEIISETSGKNFVEKGYVFFNTLAKIFNISREFKPDMYIGRYSPMMAINSFLFRKPHIIYEDTEHALFCLAICRLFSNVIVTSTSFTKDLGSKQLKIEAYKELFYLHPNYFSPNNQILKEINVDENQRFIIVRFVAWDAHHDIGQHGISDKIGLVKELENYGRVIITSEGVLPTELEEYRMRVSPEKLHDLLYYATLYVGEGSTTASECAVLGTHAIYVNTLRLGYINEEEEKYKLVYTFSDPFTMEEGVLEKAQELLRDPDLQAKGKVKRERLLADKIDVTAFMVWFVENYPESATEMRKNSRVQYSCISVVGDER
ncbi:DUF354 domain-containing protein [Methanocalculus taiwanensis]|uniref:DUF354 domain-containing protein n=1 Tax=Methanocalculus taiwanensis TaxID=106207 RepID=A0ABD4TML5_9EURY|nr:DUF354 domain-containing protein [Methanocalculus taiwanensis]MCQ1539537.1 DUF354 domain-containing protein [Methanocalculus taiwanensis]